MRTTLAIDDTLLKEAKKQALAHHQSLAKYIESAVREKLAEDVREAPPPYRPLKTFKGTGVRPGIDLNDSAGLLDAMDGNL
jgi:hypothetical protein